MEELHNTMEDLVVSRVGEIFETINKESSANRYCTCEQCRMDIICYTLNRLQPHYIVSSRGVFRAQQTGIERQQQIADITALIHEGFKQVFHNQRPNFAHAPSPAGTGVQAQAQEKKFPVFNIPVVIGRLFDGNSFAPISDVDIELVCNGELVPMKDGNWQNPLHLVHNTDGNFSFWPAPVKAHAVDEPRIFEYTVRITAPEFETLSHFFKVPLTGEAHAAGSFSLKRTFKLPHLYLFPPGEAEKNG
ncbi:MAG: late competence development ComFB family protein [Treponema sp.]|nr:late competence development ComFB family protein [Treponema sp.]